MLQFCFGIIHAYQPTRLVWLTSYQYWITDVVKQHENECASLISMYKRHSCPKYWYVEMDMGCRLSTDLQVVEIHLDIYSRRNTCKIHSYSFSTGTESLCCPVLPT